MIHDSERREVAARLRKTRVERYNSILNGIHLGEIAGVCAQIVSPHEDQVRAAADRLADLIEPPKQCPYYHSDRHRCSAYDDVVDRDALLKLADEMERMQHDAATAATDGVVDAWCLREYARCIREALGVTDG